MNTSTHASLRLGIVLLTVVLASAYGPEAQAQKSERAGTSGASQLLVPLTARHAALGTTTTSGLADLNGLEALHANPAGLTVNTGTSALFSRMDYVADIGVNYFGVVQSIGNNDLAFTVSAWDFGEIAKQTETAPEISSVTYNINMITAGLTYARQLTDRIAAGTTLKIVSESIDAASATAVAFDAGMTYIVGESGLRLGVSLKNVGNSLTYRGNGLVKQVRLPNQPGNATANAVAIESEAIELPFLLNFGMAFRRELGAGSVVTVLGNFRSNSFEQDQYAGGLELGFQDIVYVRGGYQLTEDLDQTFYRGPSFGAGLKLNVAGSRIMLDYAYVPTDFFQDVQYITASVTL